LIDTEAYLYISIHQSPFYPFTGVQDDDTNVLNVPLNNGTSGSSFLNAIRTSVLPRLRKYDPQILFLSAGFDAHRDDPLADMTLESSDFAAVTKILCNCVDVPIISCLEGGYRLSALRSSVREHARVLFAAPPPVVAGR